MLNITKIQKELKKLKVDAFLVSKPENIYYLSNFKGSFGLILATKKIPYLITDSRYIFEAKKVAPAKFTVLKTSKTFNKNIESFLKKRKIKKIGFEADSLTITKLKNIKKLAKVSFKPLLNTVEKHREIKNQEEIGKIQKAQQICDKILKDIRRSFKTGVTENEISWKIKQLAHKYGIDELSFPTIVAFGKNSATPHHQTSDKKLKKGDIILIDMGVKYKNYNSDITRVFFTKRPSKNVEKIYNTVLACQQKAISKLSTRITAKNLEQHVRNFLIKKKLNRNFCHSLGHGVGLEIHENPTVSYSNNQKFKKGHIFTIEPGLYFENSYGIRIEDVVLIDGKKIKILSRSPKDLEKVIIDIK